MTRRSKKIIWHRTMGQTFTGFQGARASLQRICPVLLACLLVAMMSVAPAVAQTNTRPQVATQPIATPPIATGARLAGDKTRTRFVLDLTHAVSFNVSVLADPFRIIIDLPEINFQLAPGLGRTGRGLVSAYRYGRFSNGRSRIVLDSGVPVLIEKSFSLKAANGQPARVVLDLIHTTRSNFLKQQALSKPPEALPPPAPVPVPRAKPLVKKKPKLASRSKKKIKKSAARRIIVIDPGHGGVDPGAIGHKGTPEKKVVFAFAKTLQKILKSSGKYSVLLTRNTDTFMRLRQRVNIARRANADLFISIHADSLKTGKARGATIYTLSETASDREAAALATQENRVDIIAGVNLETESDEVTGILIDLAQRETKNHSIHFAKKLISSMKRSTKFAGKPHRFAGFRVLTAPDIPSVLIELGYLSSRRDEVLLNSAKWRKKLAAQIAKSIGNYFKTPISVGNL